MNGLHWAPYLAAEENQREQQASTKRLHVYFATLVAVLILPELLMLWEMGIGDRTGPMSIECSAEGVKTFGACALPEAKSALEPLLPETMQFFFGSCKWQRKVNCGYVSPAVSGPRPNSGWIVVTYPSHKKGAIAPSFSVKKLQSGKPPPKKAIPPPPPGPKWSKSGVGWGLNPTVGGGYPLDHMHVCACMFCASCLLRLN